MPERMNPNGIPLSEIMRKAVPPILILSSKAGFGNFSVAQVLLGQIPSEYQHYHYSIEELISDRLRHSNFDRYRDICENYPWLLEFVYRCPVNYAVKYIKELFLKDTDLKALARIIKDLNVKTVICTNHRAAFWVSALKARKEISCEVWGVLTDFYLGAGWKYVFHPEIERLFGMLEPFGVSERFRDKYEKVELLISGRYQQLSAIKPERNHVLIAGGGWGLGRMEELSERISRRLPEVILHIACGDNQRLNTLCREKFKGNPRVSIYPDIQNLFELIEKCAIVITKPGAITISEAYAAGRKILLTKGLPVIERTNRQYAIKHFGAKEFSFKALEGYLRRD